MSSKRLRIPALLLCLLLLAGCAAPAGEAAPSPAAPSAAPTATPTPMPTPTPAPTPTPEPIPESTPVPSLEESLPLRLVFSSGAGGWGTEITVQSDLSFAGEYSDSDMGCAGEGYPNGMKYICSFSGRFTLVQLDEHRYSLTLVELTSDYEEGKEWIENGILHISSVPYGMESGTEYILYLPNTPIECLSEEFLSWWPGRYRETWPDTLEYWGLFNVEMGYGFFG